MSIRSISETFLSKIVILYQVVQLPASPVADLTVDVGGIQKIKDIYIFILKSWV